MIRVLVVNPDDASAKLEVEWLRAAGYDVEQCCGPVGIPCPVMRALPCELVDGADVLVYDIMAAGDSHRGEQLVDELRDVYADLPIVLTVPGEAPGWIETEGPHRVTPVIGPLVRERLVTAVSIALADQGMAV